MTLPTVESKNGVPYLARTRPSDVETVDTEAERVRNHDAKGLFVDGNDAAKMKGAKRVLRRGLQNLSKTVQDAAGGAIAPEEAREVAQDALTLYGANRRSVGSSAPLVLARLLRNAVNDVVADRLTAEALRLGIATPAGMLLLELAHKCENRAERSMIAALAATKALGSAKPPKNPKLARIEAAGEETK